MSPKVALAMPISMALVMPYCSAITGDQAMAVPWPPISDTVPPSTPTAAGSPKSEATPMPVRFWASM